MIRSVSVENAILPIMEVLALNITVGPESLFPMLLILNVVPKLPLLGSGPSTVPQAERTIMK